MNYSYLKNCTDDQLNVMFDRYVGQSAFAHVPIWKSWGIGIFLIFGFGAGLSFFNAILDRVSIRELIFLTWGLGSGLCFWNICRIERRHSEISDAIRREIKRRSL